MNLIKNHKSTYFYIFGTTLVMLLFIDMFFCGSNIAFVKILCYIGLAVFPILISLVLYIIFEQIETNKMLKEKRFKVLFWIGCVLLNLITLGWSIFLEQKLSISLPILYIFTLFAIFPLFLLTKIIVSVTELCEVCEEKKQLNNKKSVGKMFTIDEIINILTREDIIEFKQKKDGKLIKFGVSSDFDKTKSTFYDKRYYIQNKEYFDIYDMKKRLLELSDDGKNVLIHFLDDISIN